jgi:MFS-type transporter involved in bile tolerance (Atg22 family)
MSLETAKALEFDMENNIENVVEPQIVTQTQNNSMYLYATAIILPLLIAAITILGLPVDKESKSGTFLKIFAIILIVISIVGMYMYHKQIDILALFKSQNEAN